ncbi:MAG: Ig-like domain-containing protein [Granulosicoccus sp.]
MFKIRKIHITAGMMLIFAVSTAFAQQAIMATGDSITAGQLRPSYRQPLLDDLSALGCTVDMVGDQTLNSFDYEAPAGTTGSHFPGFTPALGYDTSHQAFGRLQAEQLLNGATSSQYTIQPIAQYVQAEQPDFVLLHIGTNDLNGAISSGIRTAQQINNWANETAAEVDQLIDSMFASHSNPANLRILLANFIPYEGPFTLQAQINAAIQASAVYTSKLETLVESRSDSRVLIVDVATGFDVASMTDDKVHPNEIGEQHMAGAFLPVLFGAGLCPETGPAITSPANGSTTTGAPLSITWDDNGLDIDRWRVFVGDSQSGNSSTWLDSGVLGANVRSVIVPSLPEDGSAVFISLNYRAGGVWNQLLTSFISEPAVNGAPVIVSPAQGGELPGSTVSFLWEDNGTNATQWYFRIGSSVGGEQYARTRISNGAQRSAIFSGLPVDGSRVYVEFSYRPPSGSWVSTNLTYDAALLTGNNQAPVAVDDLVTGLAPGGTRSVNVLDNDTDSDGTIDSGTVSITAQPSQGSVAVLGSGQLRYTHNGGTSPSTDTFRYTVRDNDGSVSNQATVTVSLSQTGSLLPELTSPAPGSQLPGSDVTFQWASNAPAVSQFYIRVGRSAGSGEFAEQRFTDPGSRQYTVNGLPTDGSSTVFVQFSYYLSGRWTSQNYAYIAASSGT